MSFGLINKIFSSALSAAIMMAVANPMTYSFVENVVSGKGDIANFNGCPTVLGHLVHTIVFFILIFAVMLLSNYGNPNAKPILSLIKYTFYGALIFFAVTNTEIYKLTGSLTNGATADFDGCPTQSGVLLHGLVYFIIVFLVMLFPNC